VARCYLFDGIKRVGANNYVIKSLLLNDRSVEN
jgi:hypothetical protein